MQPLIRIFLISLLFINLNVGAAMADSKDIGTVNFLADSRLSAVLSQLASQYAREKLVTVSGTFGASDEQEKRIEDGESADLFITDKPELLQQMKNKGLVDVYTIGRLASLHGTHYSAAVVASENMSAARSFLAYLKTDEAHEIMLKNGLSIP